MDSLKTKYEILETLSGGQAIIYKARDRVLDRLVAIKTPNESVMSDPHKLEKFIEEGRKMARLKDQNVLRVLHFVEQDEIDDKCYLITEWMDQTLEDALHKDDLDVNTAASILVRILKGLHALHNAGIVHRDLKPSNIYLSSDGSDVRIADLGIASDVGADETLTATPKYIAPEIYQTGGEVDRRSDLYSLGVLAYEMFLGRERFEQAFAEIFNTESDKTRNARWLNWHLDANRSVPPLKQLLPEIPQKYSDIVERMMAKNPAERFSSADEILREFGEIQPLNSTAFEPLPIPVRDRSKKIPGWHKFLQLRWLLPLSALLIAFIVALSYPYSSGDIALADQAFSAAKAAKDKAVAAGAEIPPAIETMGKGSGLGAQAAEYYNQRKYDFAVESFESAIVQFKLAEQSAWLRRIEKAKQAARKNQQQAVDTRADQPEAVEAYSLAMAEMLLAQQAMDKKQFEPAEKSYLNAAGQFLTAIEQAWLRRIGNADKVAQENKQQAIDAGADQPEAVEAYSVAMAEMSSAQQAMDKKQFETAEKSYFKAAGQYLVALEQAEIRNMQSARTHAIETRDSLPQAPISLLEKYSESYIDAQKFWATAELQSQGKHYALATRAYTDAATAYQAASGDIAVLVAWQRMRSTRKQVLASGIDPAEPEFVDAEQLRQQGLDAYEQHDFIQAEPVFDRATEAYLLAQESASERALKNKQGSAQLGSTEQEIDAAMALCKQYTRPCKREWYATETLRDVQLSPFIMDPTEVSNSQFAEFVDATGHLTRAEITGASRHWIYGVSVKVNGYTWKTPLGPDTSYLDMPYYPVVHVTQADARAYCEWQNKRLPSEDEWEFAARGKAHRIFPWGDDWNEQNAVWNTHKMAAVTANPRGSTPGGILNLSGNVWEWTSTQEGNKIVLKGGSWSETNPANLRAAVRRIEDSGTTHSDDGFRCVSDVESWPER